MAKDFKTYPAMSEADLQEALGFCVKQIVTVLPEFTDKFQKAYSNKNFYEPTENVDWTTGFWTGEVWLAYEYVRDNPQMAAEIFAEGPGEVIAKLRTAGEVQIASFMERS